MNVPLDLRRTEVDQFPAHWRGNHAVRSDRWRYIRYEDGFEELYDHDKDPWEWTNVAADPKNAKILAAHRQWLPRKEAEIGVPSAPISKAPRRAGVTPEPYKPAPGDILISDFEGIDYGDWKATGDAVGTRPAIANVNPRNKVTGHLGKGLVNTFRGGDKPTGSLTSPPFAIEKKQLNFLIGGGKHAGKTCINLKVGGKIVRSAVGPAMKNSQAREIMDWHSWDLSEFEGEQAVIEIADNHSGGWGHILVDHIFQSDRAMPSQPK